MKETIHKCDHIGMFTNNSKRLVDFYTKNLGFKKGKTTILSKSIIKPLFGIPTDCKFIKLVSEDVMIEIFEPILIRGRKRINNIIGYNHWGYWVGDRIKFVQKLKRKKVRVIKVKRDSHSVYFITDPDGNRIEIRDCRKSGR